MNEGPDVYLRVRDKEGRLYPDDMVRRLPEVPADHPLRDEWRARARSADRIASWIAGLPKPARVLDLGCGNGWLASTIAAVAGAWVVGVDRNRVELDQARRVFADRGELAWIAGDIFGVSQIGGPFDAVLLASAIQYFPDLPRLIGRLIPMLSAAGEIHVLDSPLYPPGELSAARERSRKYYQDLGFPEMADHYHHHTASVLDAYNAVRLYSPGLRAGDSPFPWICLRPKE